MKSLKSLTLAAVLALLAGESHAAGSHTTPCYFDGKTFNADSGCTLNLKPGSAVNSGGPTFSPSLTGNPLIQENYTDVLVSTSLTSAAMTPILASAAGTTIYPNDVTIMVSGTAATATALALECSDGTLLASWPIAELVNNVPVGLYVSSAGPTLGTALGKGCPASTALMLSNVGTNITTTTHVYTNVQYTTQHP
jgi:hypothetical protein